MKDISIINNRLKEDKDLKLNLDMLVDYSLANKTLIFNQSITGIDFEKLIESQLIKRQSDKYHIIDFESFGFQVYSLYKGKSKVILTKDFKTFVLLLEEIESDYKSEKFIQNISSLFNDLWAIAILDSNRSFDNNFTDYLKSLDIKKNSEEIFSFNEGYSRALHLLKLEVPNFYKNGIQLINWTKSDADYNMPLGSFLRGVRNKIKENEKWGFNCFEYSVKQPDLEIDFLIPIITGLYDKDGLSFYKKSLEDKVNVKTYTVSIICGLSNVEFVKKEECELFFEIFNQADKYNNHILLNLPKLLFAILRSKEESVEKKHITKAFSLLEELLEIDNANLVLFILRENEFQDDHLELRQELIISLIKKPHFKQEYLNSINHFLWQSKNIIYFKELLCTIGEFFPFKTISKNLSSSINEFRSNCKKEFDKVIVDLLIQDKASLRFIATDIFSDFSLENYKFDCDILELDSLSQYKLWVSIFQNYREPKKILPCVLPLLKSKSSLVKEAFICKLEEYTESYGDSVTDILKQELDFGEAELKAVFERIEKYMIDFYDKNVNVKDGIKELNPAYTQNRLFIEFNRSYNRHFTRQFQKSSNENSFILNLCSKVTLLKGGGWKIDGRNEISKLGKISTSLSLPRMYFTRPENFDFESSVEMATNWDDTSFAEIKRFLNNE